MALIDDIRAQAASEHRVIASITDAVGADMERVLSRLTAQIARLLGTLETATSAGILRATNADLGRALRLRTEIVTLLDRAGFAEVVAAMPDALTPLAERLLRGRSVAASAARITPISLQTLEALQVVQQADLLALGDDVAREAWRSILDGVLGTRPVDTLADEIADQIQGSARQARTIVDTGVTVYSRQVRELGLDPAPGDRYLYLGPSDARTRPFCRALVGQVRTRAEISALDNGQLPTVLLTGGGYNCRHTWHFIGSAALADLEAA